MIRSVLKEKPHLKKCLTQCRHCHILFFTHPRNAGRSDLGCPFGCREAHTRKNSIHRSTEYYRSKEGKIKKRSLNSNRSQKSHLAESDRDKNGIDDATVHHIRMVTSLIEGRNVGFKRLRCAKRLGISMAPYASMGADEVLGIIELIRISNARSLSILEQARFVDEVNEFVRSVSGKNLSIRTIGLLANGYFRGPEALREQIKNGHITSKRKMPVR